MEYPVNDGVIEIKRADITREPTDAIVNAANSRLQHGGGVAGAIVRRGGQSIQTESDAIGGCAVGGAVVTGAGRLPCRYVIHTVGPRQGEGDEKAKLCAATRNSLLRARELGIASVAFPAVSTGIFGYPVPDCARAMLTTTLAFLGGDPGSVTRVVYCLFDDETRAIFEETIDGLLGSPTATSEQ